ncbi:MAG TPA: hypothetical protein DHN33_06425 [Eubacteriaceae bacterium]|nr:hypothetical protein [Eubacteriaceae bacterium]
MMNNYSDKMVDHVCSKHSYDSVNLLPILQELQEESTGNYISEFTAREVAKTLGITESRVYDVVTYFSALSSEPRGENIIQICNSTTCNINSNRDLIAWFENALGIEMGETTPDQKFSLIYTHCIGACDLSPAVRINHDVYGNLTEEQVNELVQARRNEHATSKVY